MRRTALATAFLAITVVSPANARLRHSATPLNVHRAASFLTVLDRDGDLSAGWIDILPVLATSCNFRLDNGELTSRLIDLSHEDGNVSYTRDLYVTLHGIQTRRAKNSFVQAWAARFEGRQKEACETAEALWGDGGHQFPGVLKREAVFDGVASVPPATCK